MSPPADQDFKRFIAALKDRLPVSDVVGNYVRLKREGREWKGLSPFTQEKTPSFTVNDQKQFWHCFSSGKHGDVISFLTETQNMSFMEAVEWLAGRAGLEVPRRRRVDPVQERRRKTAFDVLDHARRWFQQQLSGSPGGTPRARAACDYLDGRNVSADAREKFGIGFAPGDRGALRHAMIKAGFDDEILLEAGLIIKPDNGSAPYDRFFNRIMFPIENRKGETIAFGARALDPHARAKYLNSPETQLFHKGSMLYGLKQAMKPAFDKGEVIIVEGYMDVLALHDAGIFHAVASLGTALSEQQIGEAWRLAAEPVICLDGDAAGKQAAARVIERALPVLRPDKSLRFAYMPSGKDPDDVIRQEGIAAFEAYLADAHSLSDALYIHETQNKPLDTPERKARLQKRFDMLIGKIPDPDIQRYYRQLFRMRLDQYFWHIDKGRSSLAAEMVSGASAPRQTPDGANEHERIVLGILVARSDLLAARREDVEKMWLASDPHRHLRDELLLAFDRHEGEEMTAEFFYEALPAQFQHLLDAAYGRNAAGQADGHNFYRLFPPLAPIAPVAPASQKTGAGENADEKFAEACLDYFLRHQSLKAMMEDYLLAIRDYRAQMNETARARFVSLKEEIEKEKAALQEKGMELSQRAEQRQWDQSNDWASLFDPNMNWTAKDAAKKESAA